MNKLKYYYLILRKVILTRDIRFFSKRFRVYNYIEKGRWWNNKIKLISLQKRLNKYEQQNNKFHI